jgi:hypothetical protein
LEFPGLEIWDLEVWALEAGPLSAQGLSDPDLSGRDLSDREGGGSSWVPAGLALSDRLFLGLLPRNLVSTLARVGLAWPDLVWPDLA